MATVEWLYDLPMKMKELYCDTLSKSTKVALLAIGGSLLVYTAHKDNKQTKISYNRSDEKEKEIWEYYSDCHAKINKMIGYLQQIQKKRKIEIDKLLIDAIKPQFSISLDHLQELTHSTID